MRKKFRKLKIKKRINYTNYDEIYTWKEVLFMIGLWTIALGFLALAIYYGIMKS